MRYLVFVLVLAACGAQPSPWMLDATRTEVTRDGRDYVVFQRDRRVEVVRLGYARWGEHQAIRATMLALVPEVTGCVLSDSTWEGDSGQMRGNVRC